MRSHLETFSRSQVASFIATVLDYGALVIFTELLEGWYVIGTALGALLGALANFLLNRYWTFEARAGHLGKQAFRYGLVSGGSLLLNTGGVYLLTEFARLYYLVSVVIISIGVGLFFNYPLFHSYVYKREEPS